MKKVAAGIALSMSLVLAGAVYADEGEGAGRGQHRHDGAQHGMQHGMQGGMEHGMRGHGEGRGHGMTAEERAAFREKMRNATPEERRKLADARRAEMHQRMEHRGGMQHEHRGPRGAADRQTAPAGAHTH